MLGAPRNGFIPSEIILWLWGLTRICLKLEYNKISSLWERGIQIPGRENSQYINSCARRRQKGNSALIWKMQREILGWEMEQLWKRNATGRDRLQKGGSGWKICSEELGDTKRECQDWSASLGMTGKEKQEKLGTPRIHRV